MNSNYEANRQVARQRIAARQAEAERERLLRTARGPSRWQRFRLWLRGGESQSGGVAAAKRPRRGRDKGLRREA